MLRPLDGTAVDPGQEPRTLIVETSGFTPVFLVHKAGALFYWFNQATGRSLNRGVTGRKENNIFIFMLCSREIIT